MSVQFSFKGGNIASRYDELISRLKCDNYVEVDRPSAEAALSILKDTNNVSNKEAHKVTFDMKNYYQYNTRPANQGQAAGNNNPRNRGNQNQNSKQKWPKSSR